MKQFSKYGGLGVHTGTLAVAVADSNGVGMSGRIKLIASAVGLAAGAARVRQRNIDHLRKGRYSGCDVNQWHDIFSPDEIAA